MLAGTLISSTVLHTSMIAGMVIASTLLKIAGMVIASTVLQHTSMIAGIVIANSST